MLINNQGWLETVAQGLPAVTHVPALDRTSILTVPKPLGIVWHWTGGRGGFEGFGPALANEIRTYDKMKDRPASWHVLVCKDGRLIQSVPFTKGSWHVGKPGLIGSMKCININRATVGVELENAGRLEKKDGRFYCHPFVEKDGQADPKLEVPANRVQLHGSVYFDHFPVEQEMAATRLLQALVGWGGWKMEVCRYGHFQFDPQRREDPGSLWMEVILPLVLDRIFGTP